MRSITAIVRGRVSTRFATKTWIRTDAPVITGNIMIPTRNDLVRIIEPNSVDATIQIFRRLARKCRLLCKIRRGDPYEDVVQRRPRDLKMRDSRTGHQGLQQPLGIAGPSHFLVVALVGELFDSRDALKGVYPVVGLNPNRVKSVGGLDFSEGAIENFLSFEDHENAIAEPLGDRHVMGREDDCRSRLLEVEDRVFEHFRIGRGRALENGSSRIKSCGLLKTAAMNCTF